MSLSSRGVDIQADLTFLRKLEVSRGDQWDPNLYIGNNSCRRSYDSDGEIFFFCHENVRLVSLR